MKGMADQLIDWQQETAQDSMVGLQSGNKIWED